MMIVKERYPLHYFEGDYDELVPAATDTFFEEDGKVYAQFNQGQLISREVYSNIWGGRNPEEAITKEEVTEVFVVEEVQSEPEFEQVEEVLEEVLEVQEEVKEEEVIEEVLEVEPEKEQPTKEEAPEPKGKSKKKK